MSDVILGLTGGIASGKSAAGRCFEALGVTVVDADAVARDVVARGTPGLAAVRAAFGEGVLAADGSLDRAAMRRRVFADDEARRQLEAIVHPRVRTALEAACRAAQGPYAVAMIPLLAEAGRAAYPWIGRIVVVDVPVALQLARLMERDGIDRALAERMLAAQATRATRLAIADDVLVNTGTPEALCAQVGAIDRRLRAPAAAP